MVITSLPGEGSQMLLRNPSTLLSHLRELFSGCLENFFVIGRFRYIPSLRDDWEGPILWVPQRKISPSSGRSRESGKIKPSEHFFRSPSLSKELAGPFLWVLPKRILKSPSSGRSWEGEKYKDQGEIFFCGVKIVAIARFDL